MPVPVNRPAGLRDDGDRLRSRQAQRRAEKPEALHMWSYRNEGAFHEAVTNAILDDLVKAIAPRFMRLTAQWYVRGGIFTTVMAEHRKKGVEAGATSLK